MRLAAAALLVGISQLGIGQALAQSAPMPATPAPAAPPPATATAPVPPAVIPIPIPKPEIPAAPTVATVIVTIENIEEAKGIVNVALCNKSLSREGCPYGTERPATVGTMEVVFENIPPGRYAVVGYHDLNKNNEFDRNLVGLPQEPYAMSGAAATSLVPKFADAALPLKAGENTVKIRLSRFLSR